MFRSESMLGARESGGTAGGAIGLLIDPEGYLVSSATTGTSWGAGMDVSTIGLKGTAQVFRAVVPAQVDQDSPRVAPRVYVRVPWTLTTASGGTPTATMQVSLFVNGVLVGAAVNGAARSLSAANGTKYTEIIAVTIAATAMALWTPGTTVDIVIQPIVIVATGGTTCELTLRHDPQTIDDQLVVEFQGLQGVV
jgi:hypothetical protein